MGTDRPSAIVVGAGVLGAGVADALARRGWDVTIVERYAPLNARGSSGDRSRLLRFGHGERAAEQDDWYMRSAVRGMELWKQLAQEQGIELVQNTGLTWFVRSTDGLAARLCERLGGAGLAHELLDPGALRALFPDLAVDDLAGGVHEPDACVIRAGDAVAALVRRAREHGARLTIDRAAPGGPGRVELAEAGGVLEADHVVWACGAWLGALLPDDAPVRPSWQEVLHWQTPGPAWRGGPAWVDAEEGLYGFPDFDGLGVKIVSEDPGPDFDLDRDARVPQRAAAERVARYIERRFPALRDTGLLWGRVMPYEMTPDGHFVVGPSTRLERHWVVGGGSGHGFKHGISLGEHVADLVEGRAQPLAMLAPGPRAEVAA